MGRVSGVRSIGIVRKVDELGRIVIPVELRRNLDIAERDPLEIYVNEKRSSCKSTDRTACSAEESRRSASSRARTCASNAYVKLRKFGAKLVERKRLR